MADDRLRLEYIDLEQARLWDRNPKRHDFDALATSIKRYGFKDPPKFEPLLNDGQGGIVEGNGRMETLQRMKKANEDPPRGIATLDNGNWAIPVLFGVDSDSEVAAEAYGVDHNQITMMGSGIDIADFSSMWNDDIGVILKELSIDDELPVAYSGDEFLEYFDLEEEGERQMRIKSNIEHVAGSLQRKFLIPPFSVLDCRQGYWRARKRLWLQLGIKSELGRDTNLISDGHSSRAAYGKEAKTTPDPVTGLLRYREGTGGTSIFDPVLAEVVYTWFTAPGFTILDPFAGGSVRGVVAGMLGRQYTGIELRLEQVKANMEQLDIFSSGQSETHQVKISSKWANHKFPCWPKYITKNCHGRCCEGSNKIMISLLPEEAEIFIEEYDLEVKDGLLQPDPATGKCPLKEVDGEDIGLCKIHGAREKPFGCIASPFTLNSNDTLIIRNRYNMLKCHGQGEPAYITFRASLDLIFGEGEAARICVKLAKGSKDFMATVSKEQYHKLKYLDNLKHNEPLQLPAEKIAPVWIHGNSENLDSLTPGMQYDFIFSCPPYYNLEVYSDLDGELSAIPTYAEFLIEYRQIIFETCKKLKDNRFACFVVGEIRNKKSESGEYYGFIKHTIEAFQDAGLQFYNEAILFTATGTLRLRIGTFFPQSRKLGKTHQNVLVFLKGDCKKAVAACGEVEVFDPEDIATDPNSIPPDKTVLPDYDPELSQATY